MSTHSSRDDIRRSEYLTLFLQLRRPLSSSLPLFDKWRKLVFSLVGDVRTFGTEVSQGKSRNYPCTALSQIDITGCGALVLTSGDAVSTPRAIEFLVQLDYSDDTVCCGFGFGPSVLIVFGLSYMSKNAVGVLDSDIVEWFAECAQLTDAKYGLIDVADGMETGIGRWLGGSDQLYASFQRRLARRMWAREVNNEPKAIGVYWANLLGSEMIERMGGRLQISQEAQHVTGECSPSLLLECPDGAAIVLLSHSITDFVYPRIGITWTQFDRAEWLHRRLAQAGLLPGFPERVK